MTFATVGAAEGFANFLVFFLLLLIAVALLRWALKIDLIVKRLESILEELQRFNNKKQTCAISSSCWGPTTAT